MIYRDKHNSIREAIQTIADECYEAGMGKIFTELHGVDDHVLEVIEGKRNPDGTRITKKNDHRQTTA